MVEKGGMNMIASVRRACQILSCFSQDEPVLSNAEIAERLGLSRSTTHHLISTLCNEGVLMREADRKIQIGLETAGVDEQRDVSAGFL